MNGTQGTMHYPYLTPRDTWASAGGAHSRLSVPPAFSSAPSCAPGKAYSSRSHHPTALLSQHLCTSDWVQNTLTFWENQLHSVLRSEGGNCPQEPWGPQGKETTGSITQVPTKRMPALCLSLHLWLLRRALSHRPVSLGQPEQQALL